MVEPRLLTEEVQLLKADSIISHMAGPRLPVEGHLVGYINMVGLLLLTEDRKYSAEEVQLLEADL